MTVLEVVHETRYRYAAGLDPYAKKAKGAHFYKAKGYGERAAFWLRPYHPPAEELVEVLGRLRAHARAEAAGEHDCCGV